MPISASQYVEKTEKGLVHVAKINSSYAMLVTKFNPEDGSPADPELVALSLDALNGQKTALLAEAANVQILIDDLTALG